MQLTKYMFSELKGLPGEWSLSAVDFESINLLVGKNASGKTRILNTISVLSQLFTQKQKKIWRSGCWQVEFKSGKSKYKLYISIEDSRVVEEELRVNDVVKVSRSADGTGKIYYHEIKGFLNFKVSGDEVAVSSRRDSVQHPYLEPLFEWAESVRLYPFSSELGRRVIHLVNSDDLDADVVSENLPRPVANPDSVVEQYVEGVKRFSTEFDRRILKDFAAIGYQCSSIDAIHAEEVKIAGKGLPVMLQVQEKALRSPTRQIEMSTGMFRSLALIVHLNYQILSGVDATILVDDIGEGLDFERSTKMIDLLIRRCKGRPIQLFMTSNDRFVMNAVDLRYWHVVTRDGSNVFVYDYENSRDAFDRFKMLGLSNFDFFARGAYVH